jgi:hypothetical protein
MEVVAMLSAEDSDRLERFAEKLKSSIGRSSLKDRIKVIGSPKIVKSDTDGGLITVAKWPEVNAEIQVWLDRSQPDKRRHFWVGFWTKNKLEMNKVVLNMPTALAPSLAYYSDDWKKVSGGNFRLKRLKQNHGKAPIYEDYGKQDGCYFGIAEMSKTGMNFNRASKFIPRVVTAVGQTTATSWEKLDAYFAKKVAKSLGDRPEDRAKRLASAPPFPAFRAVTVREFVRNEDVVAEVLYRAHGRCGSCRKPAPFKRTRDGSPYLEVHHKIPLADDGEDTVQNAIALCPNCHRKFHFGVAV